MILYKHLVILRIVCFAAAGLVCVSTATAQRRQLEKLGRGVVAVRFEEQKVFVGWRLLGPDPETIAFNVYRITDGTRTRLNASPIVDATSFVDTRADFAKSNSYSVRPVVNGREQRESAAFTLPANAPTRQYLAVSLKTPEGYAPNDGSNTADRGITISASRMLTATVKTRLFLSRSGTG